MVKRVFYFISLIILLLMCYPVEAAEYETGQLILVGDTATVKTEKFIYNDFVYQSTIDTSGNGKVTFGSINNNMVTSSFVSIDLLLFDASKKNIGFLTYCSDKDINSDNEGFKLAGGQSSPFSIFVGRKYFGDNKSSADVKYVAVLDDNSYCKIGGYDKYLGKSVDEIVNEANNVVIKQKTGNNLFLKYVRNSKITTYVVVGGLIIFGFFFIGAFLSNLYNKMYGKSTTIAYLPIFNLFIGTKLAFGNIVASIFIVVFAVSIVLLCFKISILFYSCCVLCGLAFLVDIIKLITGNYDLFYFEPSLDVKGFEDYKGLSTDNEVISNEPVKPINNNIISNNSPILDLDYDESNNDVDDDFFDISAGEGSSELTDFFDNSDDMDSLLDSDNTSDSQFNNEDDSEESDLSKYFH